MIIFFKALNCYELDSSSQKTVEFRVNYPAHRAGHLKKVLTTWHCRPLCLTPLWNLSNNLLELNLVILSETKDLFQVCSSPAHVYQ